MSHPLLESIHRILTEDRFAVAVTICFVLVQLGIFRWVRSRTGAPLEQGKNRLAKINAGLATARHQLTRVESGDAPATGPDVAEVQEKERTCVAADPKVQRAWDLSVGAQRDAARAADAVEPEIVFASGRLLPREYNARLDSAASSLFTALGIMGTFVGLILGFLQVNPDQATQSVGPLIGGMVVAFVNSLVGVLLSIVWSYNSRVRRHEFDEAAEELLTEVEYRFSRSGIGEQLRAGFEVLHSRLEKLQASTVESSQSLLNGLSPKLADSFKSLVSTPFEQLTRSVEAFDRVVRDAMGHQETIAEQLAGSTAALSEAKSSLAESVATAQECVQQFHWATEQLRVGSDETRGLVEETRTASQALEAIVAEVRQTSEQHAETTTALRSAAESMTATGQRLDRQSEAFGTSAEQLERTVAMVRSITEEGVAESVATVHGELQAAVEAMLRGVGEVGEATVRAHTEGSERVVVMLNDRVSELTGRVSGDLQAVMAQVQQLTEGTAKAQAESSERIITTLDSRVTELTGRLTKDLSGIAARLPEEVEALNQSMLDARKQMLDAYADGTARIVESLETVTSNVSGRLAADLKTIAEQFPEQVRTLTEQMGEVHARTLEAYRESSDRVIETVDERMSDLTDRLSAELTTLANRLPSEVASLNQAMSQIRAQIQKATRSMDDAVQQLAVQTPQALQAQLKEFDGALAQAMNHFSGTLMQWDGKIKEIQTYSDDLRRLASVATKRFPAPKIAEVTGQ